MAHNGRYTSRAPSTYTIDTQHKAVFFDMDGTLVLTDQLQSQAHLASVQALGGHATAPMEGLYEHLIGLSFEATRDAFMHAAGLVGTPPIQQAYNTYFLEIYFELVRNRLSEPVPGARALLARLRSAGYRLALVSSSPREEIELVLKQTGIREFFATIVASEDVAHPKPAADPYLFAARLVDLPRAAIVTFEDSESGIHSAQAAGIRVFRVQYDPQDGRIIDGVAGVVHSLAEKDLEARLF